MCIMKPNQANLTNYKGIVNSNPKQNKREQRMNRAIEQPTGSSNTKRSSSRDTNHHECGKRHCPPRPGTALDIAQIGSNKEKNHNITDLHQKQIALFLFMEMEMSVIPGSEDSESISRFVSTTQFTGKEIYAPEWHHQIHLQTNAPQCSLPPALCD